MAVFLSELFIHSQSVQKLSQSQHVDAVTDTDVKRPQGSTSQITRDARSANSSIIFSIRINWISSYSPSPSTNPSISSKLSATFDDEPTSFRPESPITPPFETPPPSKTQTTEQLVCLQSLSRMYLFVIQGFEGKRAPEDVNLDNSLEGPDTPARPPPKRRNGGKRRPSDSQEPDYLTSRYHLAPGKIPIKQRASSAPTPSSIHNEGLDINRLPELPGKYESQSSNTDPENDSQTSQCYPR